MSQVPHSAGEGDAPAIRAQLERILASRTFAASRRRRQFLQYLVEETLAGRRDRLKGYAIALEVFDRPSTFDPQVDPVVRIEAGRLRDKLREYYEDEGRDDPVRIDLPKGNYSPRIEIRGDAPTAQPEAPPVPCQPFPADAGESPDAAVEHAEHARRLAIKRNGWRSSWLVTTAALLVAAAALWATDAWYFRPSLSDKPSIAVLPFDNLGDDDRWNRFADGITEDIITDLSHAKELIVIARNSTEVYKGKPVDIRRIGRDLNVKYVLEGSIQPSTGRIRVTAQLVETAAAGHVWSERYDRRADDLFAVQNELTQRIAATLTGYQGAVAEAERRFVRRKPPASLTAYETYILGIEAKHRVTKESLAEAERLFRRAIEIDPHFARAYCGLATVQFYLIDLGLAPSVEQAVRKMTEAGEQAVKLDPNDGLTHQVLGMAYGYQGKAAQSLAALNRAEMLAPSDADLLIAVAWSLPAFGESARAAKLADLALRLNPRYPNWYNQGLSLAYFFDRQYDQSLKYRSLTREPRALDYAFAAMAHAYLGQMGDAEAAAAKVKSLDPAWNAERYLSEAGGYAEREAELFVEGSRKAAIPSCVPSAQMKDMPNLVRVKSCDKFRAGMRR